MYTSVVDWKYWVHNTFNPLVPKRAFSILRYLHFNKTMYKIIYKINKTILQNYLQKFSE